HLLADACKRHKARYTRLPSGAWHDAAVLHDRPRADGSKIPVGMLFVPCKGGISHSPEEYASPEALALGATVLADALLELVR
ncbi:MAG TPA: M20/M25/M40 family metallo-hydrolase, partial [Mariprofundaceae bacterium]|nr:M20/M25/M40 family metallo-hydrolase [Mariprofundaceae bacterium]